MKWDLGLTAYFQKRTEAKNTVALEQQALKTRRAENDKKWAEKENKEYALGHKFDELKSAVKSADLDKIHALAEEIQVLKQEVDAFDNVRRYRNGTYDRSSSGLEEISLIKEAVYQDDVSLFNTLLEVFGFDVNAKHNWLPTQDQYRAWTHEHLLIHFAIHERKKNIALAIAKDPKADVNFGWEAGRLGRHNFVTPLALARERGLNDVVLVLAKREVVQKRAEATVLESEIQALTASKAPAPSIA